MSLRSTLEWLEVADVGPDSVSVRSPTLRTMTLKVDKLGQGYHDAVRLAFRTADRLDPPHRPRPITLNAVVDRDRDGNCISIFCVGVNLGAG